MKLSEILRLVWINLIQNKFKVVLTSIGMVVGVRWMWRTSSKI